MSELDKLKDTVPDVVSGFVRYAEYNAIPETLPIKNKDILLPLLKRLKEAGSNGCLFYLYDENMVSFLNTLHSEIADFPIMLIANKGSPPNHKTSKFFNFSF